jgi:hypothetical protein
VRSDLTGKLIYEEKLWCAYQAINFTLVYYD